MFFLACEDGFPASLRIQPNKSIHFVQEELFFPRQFLRILRKRVLFVSLSVFCVVYL